MENEEKRMISSYEVTQSIHIGKKEVVFGIDEKEEYPYLVCCCTYDNPLSAEWVTDAVGSDDYLEAMQMFTDRVQEQIESVRTEQEQFKFDMTPFTIDDCIPDDKCGSIVGKVVVINAEVNRYEYRHSAYQLVRAGGVRHFPCGRKARPMGTVRRAWGNQAREDARLGKGSTCKNPIAGKGEEIKEQGGTLMEIRALTQSEQKYTYAQSMQLEGQTGCIGHLRGDFGGSGNEFHTDWSDTREQWKTDEFKSGLDDVINALREDKGLLHSRRDMSSAARQSPDAAFMGNYCTEYGFRVDIDKHAFLLRCNPTKGDYNFYCYCYVKEWLDRHISRAEQGIRFIDPHYKELFRIPDGG